MKLPEPVMYQFRWTNPGEDCVPESMLEWKEVVPSWNQTIEQKCAELEAYRYGGKQVYEVCGLVTESQLKQAVRDALEAAAQVCASEIARNNANETWLSEGKRIEDAIRNLAKEIV